MPVDISTQTDSKLVFDRIVNRITDETFMGGAGAKWDVMNEYKHWPGVSPATDADAAKHRHSYAFKGKGEAGTDEIYFGLAYSERQAVAPFATAGLPATGNIRLFGFQKYVPIIAGVGVHQYVGTWTSGVVYAVGDIVIYSAVLYLCAAAHTGAEGKEPGLVSSYWMVHSAHYRSQGYGADRSGKFTADEGFIDQWQTGLDWGAFHKMWKSGLGNIPLWLCANSRRVMWVTKSSTTRWEFSYAGWLKPFGTANTNPYPMLLAANCSKRSTTPAMADKVWEAQNVPFDYVEEDNLSTGDGWYMQNYPLQAKGARICRLDLTWGEPSIPYPYVTETPLGTERLPTGENYLRECWLHDGQGFVGALDGVYWCAAQGMASGDILTAGGQDYLVIEDVYRASSGGMFAIKLA